MTQAATFTSIGTQIKTIRKNQGMTQLELARRLGWSNSRLTNYEKDYRQPKIEVLQLIAGELGCALTDLIDIKKKPAIKKVPTKKVPPTKSEAKVVCLCCEAYKSLLIALINKGKS